MKENSSEIIVVVDRSGSMAAIAHDMMGGFDTFIAEQKKLPGECKVTLAQFDDNYELVYSGKPLAQVPKLKLEPRGTTALLDAIGKTINSTGQRLAAMAEGDRPSRILFVIITDGHENASKEFNRDQVNQLITQQREKYSWEFVFLGASQDAIDVAHSYGIPMANAVYYNQAAPNSAKAVMRSVSHMSNMVRSASIGSKVSLNAQDVYASSLADLDAEDEDKADATP